MQLCLSIRGGQSIASNTRQQLCAIIGTGAQAAVPHPGADSNTGGHWCP